MYFFPSNVRLLSTSRLLEGGSSKGNYESVTLVATVTSGKHIEEIYNVMSNIDDVRHML